MDKLAHVDETWTLFLDRDGVINERNFEGYILDYKDFHFKETVLSSAKKLFARFKYVIVVTNQQCVAKGLITQVELDQIHAQMCAEFQRNDAKIDKVYAATERKGAEPFMRKPFLKMAELACLDFPEIDLRKAIMVGDTDSDVQFGRNNGMKTVLIKSKETNQVVPDLSIDRLEELMDYI
ncbi:MAG: HAD-IIIA family hydrolase [Flavobacteriales bacterium]